MPQAGDDFTVVLPELTDMAACELKVYEGLDRLMTDGRKIRDDSPTGN
jgi:hypothetical protein